MVSMKSSGMETTGALRWNIAEVMKPILPYGTKCALLDFPNHGNVGDSAIWLGEKAYLESVGASVVYASDRASYSKVRLKKRLRGGVVLLHGGGNLGDLWLPAQRFREQVIADFPDRPIIQLPQTIHFQERKNLDRARSVFNSHSQLTLLVRDRPSLEFARNEFRAPSYLCPDMAFMLGDLRRPASGCKIVLLARTDKESAGYSWPVHGPDLIQADWRSDPRSMIFRANNFLTRQGERKTPILGALAGSLSYAYDAFARHRLVRGCKLLGQGQVVVTDRLHGHILSLLLGIPHILLDNSYGKVRSFYETWTKDCGTAVWATSLERALAAARSLYGEGQRAA
jgi:exopolysaccharide biosynthesis predicted pyruvyltransferase EpsI